MYFNTGKLLDNMEWLWYDSIFISLMKPCKGYSLKHTYTIKPSANTIKPCPQII